MSGCKALELLRNEAYIEVRRSDEGGEKRIRWTFSPPRLLIMPEAYDHIILTTAPSLEGYRITQTIDIVTAECVFGMNVFRDMFAGVRDFFGGRSKATQKVLRDTRTTALSELRQEALGVGADAVIGVRLDYSEFSGKGKAMLLLVASGTAVKIEKANSH